MPWWGGAGKRPSSLNEGRSADPITLLCALLGQHENEAKNESTPGSALQQALQDVALEDECWKPTCVNGGQKMVVRRRRRDGEAFWACPKFGCKTMPMRKGQ